MDSINNIYIKCRDCNYFNLEDDKYCQNCGIINPSSIFNEIKKMEKKELTELLIKNEKKMLFHVLGVVSGVFCGLYLFPFYGSYFLLFFGLWLGYLMVWVLYRVVGYCAIYPINFIQTLREKKKTKRASAYLIKNEITIKERINNILDFGQIITKF